MEMAVDTRARNTVKLRIAEITPGYTFSAMCRDMRRIFLCIINYIRDAEEREVVLLRDGTAQAQQNFSRDRHPRSGEGRVIFMQSKGY